VWAVPTRDEQDALYRQARGDHAAALERLARSYEADADKPRDLLQEIHLALWRSFATFDGRCAARTWTFRVAHNVATSHVIQHKRLSQKFRSLEDSDDAPAPEAPSTDRAQALERLYTLIGALNLIDHAVIVLYLEGEDASSIASVTGLSPGNVATKIHRIKALLARQFQEGGPS